MKQNGSVIFESDCRVLLIVEINCYIRGGLGLYNYNENMNLNESLEGIEKKLTTSYDTFKYSIKRNSGSEFIPKYQILFETENRYDALKKFLQFNSQNKRNLVLEVAISPFDTRCLYLNHIEEDSEIIYGLAKYEEDLENILKKEYV